MKPMFFVLMFALILGVYSYVFIRLWQIIPAGGPWRWIMAAFYIIAFASFFVSLLAGSAMPSALTSVFYKLGTSWFFITVYLLMAFLIIDLLKLTPLDVKRFAHQSWLGFGILAGIVTMVMTLGYVNYTGKRALEKTISVDKQIPEAGIRIVAISDLHLGYGIGNGELAGWVETINAQQPDIVLIAGDIIDNSLRPLTEGNFRQTLGSIKARYGVFACTGNHEFISGAKESTQFIESAGITLLRDSVAMVDSMFYVVGRDDMSNPNRKTLEELTAGLDRSKPLILLDHQPHGLEQAQHAGIDLQISGHTHRGQVWPITWITDAMYELSHGFDQKGSTHYFVSEGIGIWGGKFRIGSSSDYGVITLVPKQE